MVAAQDRGALDATQAHIAADIALSQVTAADQQSFQELRFAPGVPEYTLYANGRGFGDQYRFVPPTRYAEGYLLLPQPYLRYDDLGQVSESGQIGLVDPEGDVRDLVVYLGDGVVRTTDGLIP